MNQTPISVKLTEAAAILKALGLPKAQLNERSALCLLSLIDVKPTTGWRSASSPLMGITPMMDWMKEHYAKDYAPNTRETIRRQSMHQFVNAGIALYNPDDPTRPTNSPKAVYKIEPSALKLLKAFGTDSWEKLLKSYLRKRPSLARRYAKERKGKYVPILLPQGRVIDISPGDHSILIKAIIEDFASRFAPGSKLIYAGDTGDKFGYFDRDLLLSLGVIVDSHGKMPDVVLYKEDKDWILLVESVTSHGPVNPKRHDELSALFSTSTAKLIFVTAFPSKLIMTRYLTDIAWETEVWVADNPTHLIHFDGKHYLKPYGR